MWQETDGFGVNTGWVLIDVLALFRTFQLSPAPKEFLLNFHFLGLTTGKEDLRLISLYNSLWKSITKQVGFFFSNLGFLFILSLGWRQCFCSPLSRLACPSTESSTFGWSSIHSIPSSSLTHWLASSYTKVLIPFSKCLCRSGTPSRQWEAYANTRRQCFSGL